MARAIIAITTVFALTGCGEGQIIDQTERTAIKGGKADQHSGSCAGTCGRQSADGPCWCDEQCAAFGDCCFDKVPVCTPETCDGLDAGACTDTTGCKNSIVPLPCDCIPGQDEGCFCPLGGQRQCVPCPLLTCEIACDNGYEVDANGCGLCECKAPATCEERSHDTCEDDPNCELRILPIPCDCLPGDDGCFCPLGGALTCGTKCQPVLCELFCEDGFATDENGCGICQCNEPGPKQCHELDIEECDARTDCKTGIVPIPCDCAPDDADCFCPLGGQLQCQDACAPVLCELFCEDGFAIGDDGCEICSCKAPDAKTCAELTPEECDDNNQCEVTIVPLPCDCDPTDPDCACPLGGQLQCRDKCAPVLCALFCEHGFVTDENGCGTCACAEAPIDACAFLTIEECHGNDDCTVGIQPLPCDCDPTDADCVCPLGGQQICTAK